MDIVYHKSFKKQYEKLSKKIKEDFVERLKLFEIDPFDPILNNHKLHGELKNTRSINVSGDIRAIYEELDENSVLFFMIGSHSDLYK
jgi:addiction module RelE/StbE family toxin